MCGLTGRSAAALKGARWARITAKRVSAARHSLVGVAKGCRGRGCRTYPRASRPSAGKENFIEWKFSIPDIWSRQLFIALCRRYGLQPFRHTRMHRQTVMIKGPKSFIEQTSWPEFQELNAALEAYLSEITEKVIREEVHGETGEAEEVDAPTRIGR